MIEIPSLRPETRYGMPTADHMLFNREYIVGYSYLFRQARWAMEVIDPTNRAINLKRTDPFRPDMRIPDQFRAGLKDYVGSKHDRGHLVASADRRARRIENSETFLLTNMSPQKGDFNRGVWKKLEGLVRDLSFMYLEVYVVCGPLFDVGKKIEVIGDDPKDQHDLVIPIPHAYFKSILAEDDKNRIRIWSFILENKSSSKPIDSFLVPTSEIESRAGLTLWDRLRGEKADRLRMRKSRMWSVKNAESARKKSLAKLKAVKEVDKETLRNKLLKT